MQLVADRTAGARRVRQKQHVATACAKCVEAVHDARKGAVSIVEHAPDVADEKLEAGRDLSQAAEDGYG
jgi:hypothetical protein